jgi:hypothetical protein
VGLGNIALQCIDLFHCPTMEPQLLIGMEYVEILFAKTGQGARRAEHRLNNALIV